MKREMGGDEFLNAGEDKMIVIVVVGKNGTKGCTKVNHRSQLQMSKEGYVVRGWVEARAIGPRMVTRPEP